MSAGLRLSLFCAAIMACIGIYLPFFPVWLAARGLSPADIGLVLAVPFLMRLLATPAAAALADRLGAPAQVLALASAGVLLAYGLLGIAGGFWAILAMATLLGAFQAAQLPLMDSLILARIRARPAAGLDYGRIRAWGSASVLAGMVAGGRLAGRIEPDAIVWTLAGLAGIGALAALAMSIHVPRVRAAAAASPAGAGRLPRAAFAVIAAAALVQASHSQLYAFATLDWQGRRFSGQFIGLAWAAGVFAEVLFFLFAARHVGGPLRLLLLGGLAAALRWVVMAAAPSAPLLLLLQASHALSFGATHLGAVTLLDAIVPAARRAQAQGWLAAAIACSMGLATIACGQLRSGAQAYAAMALLALCGVATGLVAARLPRVDRG